MLFDVSVFLLKLHVFIILCTYLYFIVRVSWKISYIAKCCNSRSIKTVLSYLHPKLKKKSSVLYVHDNDVMIITNR